MADKIPLAAVLAQLSSEIRQAHEHANKTGAVMQFDECELEFGMEFEKEGDGGVRFWIFNFGGTVKKADTNTFKIKYRALPTDPKVAETTSHGTVPSPNRELSRDE